MQAQCSTCEKHYFLPRARGLTARWRLQKFAGRVKKTSQMTITCCSWAPSYISTRMWKAGSRGRAHFWEVRSSDGSLVFSVSSMININPGRSTSVARSGTAQAASQTLAQVVLLECHVLSAHKARAEACFESWG